MNPPARQRGWTLLVILIALAIAAFLGRDALFAYFGAASGAGGNARLEIAPATRDGSEAAAATPAPKAAVERAQAVEDIVLRRSEDAAKRIDGAAR